MKEKNKFDQVGCKVENWRGVEKPTRTILAGNFCMLEPIAKSNECDFSQKLIPVSIAGY